jgi:predicted TIM-barrel fold metal-dependent hydrolase
VRSLSAPAAKMTSSSAIPIVDVHSHMYPPAYISLLSSRTTVPYIHQPSDPTLPPRLIILSSDDDDTKPKDLRGRPVDETYSSLASKLNFMKVHGITCSIISLANPWLDFLPPETAASTARQINDDLDAQCHSHNTSTSTTPSSPSLKAYAFACLPLSAPTPEIISEINRLSNLPTVKGVIMGTTGLGQGLDSPALNPIYDTISKTNTMIFLHPHYGLPTSSYGSESVIAQSGHVLPLALGFPLETTIAVTRMYLAGVFDRHPKLRLLLAHSGGTLPFLAGRIQSCVEHEREFIANGGDKPGPERSIWDVLKTNIYLDAVIYGEPGLKGALAASGKDGVDRMMFGTDHPFFPPLKGEEKWASVESNLKAIDSVFSGDGEGRRKVLGGNAIRVLGLDL